MKKIVCFLLTILTLSNLHGDNINWSSPPTIISGVNTNAANPVLAMDANGNAVAAWVENTYIKTSTHPYYSNWTTDVVLSGPNASSPCLVLDQNGNAALIWIGNGEIYASTKPQWGSWAPATALSSTGATAPTLDVDAAGNLVAAWVRNGNIETSIKPFGANWQNHMTINSTSAANPSITIGGSGNNVRALLAWQGSSSGTNVIYTSIRTLSGNWSTPVVLSNPAHNATNSQVSFDANANAIAVWYEYDMAGVSFTNVTVKTSERPFSTGTWNNIHVLSAPGIRNPSSLSANIAFDGTGNAIAVWNTSFDDETFNIQSSVKPVNGQWSAPLDIVSSNLFAYNESISVTNFGAAVGLYMYYNGSSLLIQSIESNINGFSNNVWSVPITISQGSDNAYPNVAATINGNTIYAVALWENFSGSHNSIVAMTGSKTLVSPPTHLSVSQTANNFGVFTEYSNTLTWTASTDTNVAGYLIFRNGLFIEQVGANVLQFTDYNRAYNGSVTYNVTAINALETQSASVSVNFP